MSLNKITIEREINDLEKKIANAYEKAKSFVQKDNKTSAMQQLKLKKLYESRLLHKQEILNKLLMTEQQQISNVLAGDISPERREAARRRRTLKQSNGVISEDARIPGMVNRPCYTNCEKKSWCDPTGWCDSNYYCTPSNREGTSPEPDMSDQKCVPVNKKTKGGRKRKTKKSKKSKRKRKTSKRGGMRRRMTDKMINRFRNPHSQNTPNDCCPCVFSLLGMSKSMVQAYQKTHGKTGFSASALEEGMNKGFPEYHSQMLRSFDITKHTAQQNRNLLSELFYKIPRGTGAIGGIERKNGTKHCVVFARDLSGKPIVFDAQTAVIYSDVVNILNNWTGVAEPNIKYLYILDSRRKDGSDLQLILGDHGKDVTLQYWSKQASQHHTTTSNNSQHSDSVEDNDDDDDVVMKSNDSDDSDVVMKSNVSGGKRTKRKNKKRTRKRGKSIRKRKRKRSRK